MIIRSFLLLELALTWASSLSTARDLPRWSSAYSVQGTLMLPYAEIEEPFMAFFDEKAGKSRIDFYGGMDKVFQRADQGSFGVTYKVVPMTDENVVNQMSCFVVNGTSQADAVKPQSILPSLEGFSYKGPDIVNGHSCEKWQKKEVVGKKVNKYTMWLYHIQSELSPSNGVAIPVHYEMKGYNTLLGSHYDHYYLIYQHFTPAIPDSAVFDDYETHGQCRDWPGPGISNHIYIINPIKEYVDSHDDHVDRAFGEFKKTHKKSYRSDHDHDVRKDIFRQNMRYIYSKNRQGLTFKLAPNHMTDWTSGEIRQLRGKLYTPGYNGGFPFKYSKSDLEEAPEQLDWRLYGAVTPVKDQASCGSCWSFGTVGTLEGALFMQTGQLVRLSQQALVDCSWGFGNNGCDGGEDFRVYKFMMKHGGIPSEEDYGPYLGNDGYCHIKDTQPAFNIKGYVNVTSGDLDAMKVALAKHGPISVSIDAGHKSLSFYSNGVYYEPECRNDPEGLDHSVLAVGYGEIDGEKYWLIKNSWSTYWGNDGYVLMSQKGNNCGVATSGTFVIPEDKV